LRRFTAIEHVSNALFVTIHASALLAFVFPPTWKLLALITTTDS